MDKYKQLGSRIDPYAFRDLQKRNHQRNIQRTSDLEQGKNVWKGLDRIPLAGGIISGVLNAPTQVVSAGKDLAGGAMSGNWGKWNKRDHMSDLGALGETALDIATAGVGKAPKSVWGAIAKPGAIGAGFGALDTLREQGKDATMASLGASAGIGGLFGGAMGGLGYGFGKLARKSNLSPDKSVGPYRGATIDRGLQDAYATLGLGQDATEQDVNRAFKQGFAKFHPDIVGEGSPLADKFVRGNNAKTAILENIRNPQPATPQNVGPVPLSFKQRMDNLRGWGMPSVSPRLVNLIKSPVGKVGMGVGGGLALNRILGGRNAQPQEEQISPEDQQYLDLLTYIYGGE